MRIARRGMVLGIILLTLVLMAVFIFSYQAMVRQQNTRAHREQIGTVAENLAISGLNLIADHLNADPESILAGGAPNLLSGICPSTVPMGPTTCDALRDELNDYFQNLPFFAVKPECTDVDIVFTDIIPLTPNTDALQYQAGRDPVEKSGEAVLACTVLYQDLRRRAEVRRQFRVVSLVPGPFARFTLFVPCTPNYFSYNAVGVNFNGTPDSTYTPPGTSVGPFSPLKLFNSSETSALTSGFVANPPTTDLKRGWVFLGPSRDPAATGPVLLRVPSGYNSAAGGNFLFSRPVTVPPSTVSVVAPENNTDPTHFRLPPLAPAGVNAMLGGVYQGFFTNDPGLANPQMGAAGWNLWTELLSGASWIPGDRFLCAASWLFPFGDKDNVSRTLMVGPVLAGFLKFCYLKENPPSATPWKGIIRGVSQTAYNPTDNISFAAGPPPPNIRYQDLFVQPFGGKAGYGSLLTVMPTNFVVNPAASPLTNGVPFNLFFDYMAYDGPPAPYPKPLAYIPSPSGLGQPTDPYFVPHHDLIQDPAAVGIRGIHPYGPPEAAAYASKWFEIRFREGSNAPDNIYFRGNLVNYTVRYSNLMQRVTHIIDLSSCTSAIEEKEQLERFLFYRESALPPLPPTPTGLVAVTLPAPVYRLQKRGIILVARRNDGAPGGGPSWGALELPGPIFLDKSVILVVGNGDVKIPKAIRSPVLNGSPYWLCTVVSLQGNILLGTTDQIDAYLVALTPRPSSGGAGGRLLSDGTGVNRMNLVGGLAIHEMGLSNPPNGQSTMERFPQGGSIRYNPRFNPSLADSYALSRVFVLEEKARSVQVGGAD